ncbi:hypothetical protein A1332_03715 [Methylomonas methanica]|uniref:Uncharacterized protein n=1 Tax=Methylomonas methanica TaxID=421 RepID=A0A177M767_METMH|nr:hypothetical protein A1332_03715 [Methylomonas methanica]
MIRPRVLKNRQLIAKNQACPVRQFSPHIQNFISWDDIFRPIPIDCSTPISVGATQDLPI